VPIQDAVDLARFLVDTTIWFVKFSVGRAKTVGGPHRGRCDHEARRLQTDRAAALLSARAECVGLGWDAGAADLEKGTAHMSAPASVRWRTDGMVGKEQAAK
jgi:hypothetical protein